MEAKQQSINPRPCYCGMVVFKMLPEFVLLPKVFLFPAVVEIMCLNRVDDKFFLGIFIVMRIILLEVLATVAASIHIQ